MKDSMLVKQQKTTICARLVAVFLYIVCLHKVDKSFIIILIRCEDSAFSTIHSNKQRESETPYGYGITTA